MDKTISNLALLVLAGLLGAHLFIASRHVQVGRFQWVKAERDNQMDQSVVLDTATGRVYTRTSMTVPAGVLSTFEVYEYSTGRDDQIGVLNPFKGDHSARDLAKEACMGKPHPELDAFQIIEDCAAGYSKTSERPNDQH